MQGVFRDASDFASVVFADSEAGVFEHPLLRPLPDFDYTGVTLSFDLTTTGVWPIDSHYFASTNAQRLAVVSHDLTLGTEKSLICSFWENATLKTGTWSPATSSVVVTTPGSGDVITLFVGNVGFRWPASGGAVGTESPSTITNSLASAINTYDWSAFASASVAVISSISTTTSTDDTLTLTFARTGKVTYSSGQVLWAQNGALPSTALPSEQFTGLLSHVSQDIYIDGSHYQIDTVIDAKTLTLVGSPSIGAGTFTYMAPWGGEDGNGFTAYIVGTNLSWLSTPTLVFSGGMSDGITWTINLDFATLQGALATDVASVADPTAAGASLAAAGALRKAFITIAPKLAHNAAYTDTPWSVVFSNWTVSGTGLDLYVAGPGSQRVGSRDQWATYTGTWGEIAAYPYYQGFARTSSTSGDSISIKYACQYTHDLYVGTQFYFDRQVVNVSLDGDTDTPLDTYQDNTDGSPLYGRRQVRSSVAAGIHVLTITLLGTHTYTGIVVPPGGVYSFLFDYIDAAVASEVPDPVKVYPTYDIHGKLLLPAVSAALDYDTFPYQMTPQRLVWQLQKMGFLGKTNLDLGVFWLYNRVRVGGVFESATVTFGGAWVARDTATIIIFPLGQYVATMASPGFQIEKSVASGETPTTIAAHFAYYINSASVAFWASASAGVLTITQRSAGVSNGSFTASIVASATSGGGSVPGGHVDIDIGVEGTWTLDDTTSPLLNVGITAWLQDFYNTLAAASMENVTAITMELVQPPLGYAAWFADFSPVQTDTGFGTLTSEQCAVNGTKTLVLQKQTLKEIVDMQSAATLTPNWQAGEIGWWYFPKHQSVPIFVIDGTGPLAIAGGSEAQDIGFVNPFYGSGVTYIGVANPIVNPNTGLVVGLGDTLGVFISNATEDPTMNGMWTATIVVDTSHFTIPHPSPLGATSSGGTVTFLLGLPSGSTATVVGVQGATNANGTWTVTPVNAWSFTIPTTLNAAWIGGGNFSGGSMAFYDVDTNAAALTTLVRPLAQFWSQDDDPSLNPTDVTFLQDRLFAHFSALQSYVTGLYPGAIAELLYPSDVNISPMYFSFAFPFAQGGRLNRAVNWPSQLQTKATSGFQHLLMEGLSWGASYRHLDFAKASQQWPFTNGNSWAIADVTYLIPCFNGGCPFAAEYLAAVNAGYIDLRIWALDQAASQKLPLPLPVNQSRVTS